MGPVQALVHRLITWVAISSEFALRRLNHRSFRVAVMCFSTIADHADYSLGTSEMFFVSILVKNDNT
jgi:hypothetical protein